MKHKAKHILTAICIYSGLLLLSSCNSRKTDKAGSDTALPNTQESKDYLALIISFDTVAAANQKKMIFREDSLLSQLADRAENPFYHYFRGRKYQIAKKTDSARAAFQQMQSRQVSDDIGHLKQFHTLDLALGNGSMVESILMKQIFAATEEAEQLKSKFTYRFYDLLARAFYQNHNEQKSLDYAALYFRNHPFNTHPVIKQRYFDISFLLASRLGDFKQMTYYNSQARLLAKKLGDSLAIARTYDNEAQIYSAQMLHAKALASSKIYFEYLKKTNNLNDIAYNNLGTAFNFNKQPDSAIYYYKAGIAMQRKDSSGKQKKEHYRGLIDSYKMKGDFVRALEAADSAYAIEFRNYKAIEATKVAEIHEQYQTEKKDQNILQLKNQNQLNETIIHQQRWTIFLSLLILIGLLSFFYVFYRQQRLREKNKLLESENRQLNMEQKLLQAQLNPHFVFNAIANLQGLIASGHTVESVRYLKSFSGLLRGILEQNRKDFIELREEITSLHNYIQLQQMRYAGVFDYTITVADQINLDETLIPPMLIQPFVENAIEHGFRNIEHAGILNIAFKVDDDFLRITVNDNGSGITQTATSKAGKQSLAQIIIKERFDLIFTSRGQQAQFKVTDKKENNEQGVLVEITIPIIND